MRHFIKIPDEPRLVFCWGRRWLGVLHFAKGLRARACGAMGIARALLALGMPKLRTLALRNVSHVRLCTLVHAYWSPVKSSFVKDASG